MFDGLAEIVLPLVEHHREARAFVNADLDDQIFLLATPGVEFLHRRAHTQAGDDRVLGLMNVAMTASPMVFYDRALFRSDDFEQRMEMRAHQVEGDEIAYPFIERRWSLSGP